MIHHFSGQHEGEQILSVIHRHWFNILSHFFIIFFFLLILIGSFLFFPFFFSEFSGVAYWRFFLFLENTFFLFLWLFGFLLWVDYYFDVWIVTNERIINIEQKGLFVREMSELHFASVQDVTSEVIGVIPTILNYGDVTVQTAAEKGRFVFRQVPDPYKVKDLVIRLAKEKNSSCKIS